MSKAVVILGAGASASFGVPTLSRLFQDQHSRKYLQEDDKWLFDKLNDIIWAPRGHTIDTSHNSLTVEEILTFLRDQEQRGSSSLSKEELIDFRESLYVLIQKAVFVDKHTRGRYLNQLIEKMRTTFEHTTWATFNWDCIFESSFWYSTGTNSMERINPQVAVELADWRGHSSKDLLLKLHGGINWWIINDKLTYLPYSYKGILQEKWIEYEKDEDIDDYPVLLEPSYYKYSDPVYEHLKIQWQVFLENLLEADVVLILGYSLPAADVEARSTISVAFQDNQKARWAVIDPNSSVCSEYERLFGSVRLTTFEKDLANFNNSMDSDFAVAFPHI
jgi:hypothetical protein